MIFDAILSQFSIKKHYLFSVVTLDFKNLKFLLIKRRDYIYHRTFSCSRHGCYLRMSLVLEF